jgi:hypothetical protein
MEFFRSFRKDAPIAVASGLAISVLVWALGLNFWIGTAQAGNLSFVSDTLSNSAPNAPANHTIAFTTATTTASLATIVVTLDPLTSSFGTAAGVSYTDVSSTGMTMAVNNVCGAPANEISLTSTSTSSLTFTVCTGDTLPPGAKTIRIGNNKITNPASAGSYVIRVNGSMPDAGDTRVAIISNVTMSASVDTSLTFVVSPLATGTVVNVATTTGQSATTTLTFGTLTPNVPKILGQQLRVTTNAKNGFTVTVQQNQNMLSASGADINTFANQNSTSTPSPWQAPANTLDATTTYGHYGITSDDADEGSGEFVVGGVANWVGNFDSAPRAIFSHTGPADGVSQNKGAAKVAVKIEVGSLQEAANDYQNTLTYVCTPVF